MSLPNNALSTPGVPGVILFPESLGRVGKLIAYQRGGVGIGDPSEGLNSYNWRIRLVGTDVRVGREPYTTETTIFSEAGIVQLSFAFDQNMNVTVAYVVALGVAKLYWYDTTIPGFTTTTYDSSYVTPFLTLDDKRAGQTGVNDILFFYVRGNQLRYLQQRERYGVERVLYSVVNGGAQITKVGMNSGLRVQIELTGPSQPNPAVSLVGSVISLQAGSLTVQPRALDVPLTGASMSVVPGFLTVNPFPGLRYNQTFINVDINALANSRAGFTLTFYPNGTWVLGAIDFSYQYYLGRWILQSGDATSIAGAYQAQSVIAFAQPAPTPSLSLPARLDNVVSFTLQYPFSSPTTIDTDFAVVLMRSSANSNFLTPNDTHTLRFQMVRYAIQD